MKLAALSRFRDAARAHGYQVPDDLTDWRMRCPGHGGDGDNLAVREGREGVLLTCHSHQCSAEAIARALGLSVGDLFDVERAAPITTHAPWRTVEVFPYVDESEALLFEVHRQERGERVPGVKVEKKFVQSHVGADGARVWNMTGVRRVLFRLPQVIEAVAEERRVLLVEGEKCVLSLETLGFVATTSPGGAGKWVKDGRDVHDLAAPLVGAHVVLLPDHDAPGLAHVRDVGAFLCSVAASVRVLELDVPTKGDVVDWIENGGTAAALEALLASAPTFDAWSAQRADGERPTTDKRTASGASDDEGETAMMGDDALALLFSSTHADRFRYTSEWSRWQAWDGSRWRGDRTLDVFDAVRQITRALAEKADKPHERRRLTGAFTVAAVERLARSDRRHAALPEQWDAHPWLLSTPGGVVDLRTGAVRPAKPEDYLLRQAGAPPDFGAAPQRFLEFLRRVTQGDRAFIAYLQRVVGCCLIGEVREHLLFFLWGPGGTGKGTFLRTLLGIAGEYGSDAPAETFLESRVPRHPTELAMLMGKRVVVAQEVEQGARWAESRIKTLTGGDPITARYMRGDFFTFQPQFTLLLAGNHKPHFRAVDRAIKRRLRLLPFTSLIETIDTSYEAGLRAEWPAILAWGITGALEYQAHGLEAPSIVADATDEYLEGEDSVGVWIAERCLVAPENAVLADWREELRNLFESWGDFCQERRLPQKSMKEFSEELSTRGFEARRMGKDRMWGRSGIVLIQDERARVLARRRAREDRATGGAMPMEGAA